MGSGGSGSYLIGFLIAGAIAYWVFTDAKKRGMNAPGWAAGTFLLCIVFLPLYLIMRKPVVTGPVPRCGRPAEQVSDTAPGPGRGRGPGRWAPAGGPAHPGAPAGR